MENIFFLFPRKEKEQNSQTTIVDIKYSTSAIGPYIW